MSGAITAVVGVAVSAYSAYEGNKRAASAQRQQEQAMQQQQQQAQEAQKQAQEAQKQSEVAMNKANQKAPDMAGIQAREAMAGARGGGSTMLTGSTGVDSEDLTLGKKTLLGG